MVGYDKNVPNRDGLMKLYKVLDPVVRSGVVSAGVSLRARREREEDVCVNAVCAAGALQGRTHGVRCFPSFIGIV